MYFCIISNFTFDWIVLLWSKNNFGFLNFHICASISGIMYKLQKKKKNMQYIKITVNRLPIILKTSRVQASAICQALLEGGYIENISEPASFIDGYAFYKRGSLMTLPQPEKSIEISSQEEPSWVQQIPQESSMTGTLIIF